MDFIQALMSMQGGKAAARIDEKFQEVVKAVRRNGGKGKLTLTLDLKAIGTDGAQTRQVELTDKVSISKPERQIGKTFLFINDDGRLTQNDEHQLELALEQAEERKENRA